MMMATAGSTISRRFCPRCKFIVENSSEHETEPHYICSVCNDSTTFTDATRRRHEIGRHPYICDNFPSRFARPATLVSHIRLNHRRYICYICRQNENNVFDNVHDIPVQYGW